MPAFEQPAPFRPYHQSSGMSNFWKGSFYRQRVDALTLDANAATIMADFISDNTRPSEGAPYVNMTPFGQDNWNNSGNPGAGAAGYWSDRWPTNTPVTRSNWNSNRRTRGLQDLSTPNPIPYFSNLRQQDAIKFFGNYTPGIYGDRHAVLWIPQTRELVEAIGYNGTGPFCEAVVVYKWDNGSGIPIYDLPLAEFGGGPAGVCAACIPIAPFFFTYQDLLECGETGDLGHMVGLSARNYGQHPTLAASWFRWPARRSDGTIPGSSVKAGQVFRLKSTFNENTAFPTSQPLRALARTLKKYGMMIYDRNFNIAKITVPNDPQWPTGSQDLGVVLGNKLPLSQFEPVNMDPVAGPTNSIVSIAPTPFLTGINSPGNETAITKVSGGEAFTLYGSNFTGATKVVITGASTLAPITFAVASDTLITFNAPAGNVGNWELYVENIHGRSNTLEIEYTAIGTSRNVHNASTGRMGLG